MNGGNEAGLNGSTFGGACIPKSPKIYKLSRLQWKAKVHSLPTRKVKQKKPSAGKSEAA